ncbi:MAG: hypothetical protein AAFQ43_10835, partial [Bacteroidota bacterium]
CLLALLLLPLAGCAERTDAGPDAPAGTADALDAPRVAPEADDLPDRPEAQTVFDAAEAVFDTLEPPQRQTIEIAEAPQPTPPPRPTPTPVPDPIPEPLPPLAPVAPVAGSCDVRESESYCFTYTGATWSAAAAEQNCSEAPEATFRPAECPSEGRIATCVYRRGEAPAREIVYTYYEPYDLGLARIACPGRFTEVD